MKLTEILVKYFEWTPEEVESKGKELKKYTIPTELEALDRADAYKINLNLNNYEFLMILKKFPALLTYESGAIKSKIAEYIKEFNFTQQEFTDIFKKYSRIISIPPKTAKRKALIYQQAFGFSLSEFVKIMHERPNIIGAKEDTIMLMASKTADLGITKNDILKNSKILTVPAKTLKIKYLILRQVASRGDILSNDCFTTSQDKLYARLMYLNTYKKGGATLSTIIKSEPIFFHVNRVKTDSLIKTYQLTPEVIHDMWERLPEKNAINFTAEEIESYGK